ncbi:MAG: PilZ domain-containing protein [Desulforhopalus sp.]|nr:PilZ domain-containing protein [Desulforhopalus sp.]
MSRMPNIDRRRSTRLKGQKEMFLVHPNGIAFIGDISCGGLCFHCSQEEFFPENWPVEIVCAGTTLYITGLYVRLVCEQQDEVINFLTVPTKKVSVEFLDVNEQNRSLLTRLFSYLEDGAVTQ